MKTPTAAQQRQLDRLKAACEARQGQPKQVDTDFDLAVNTPILHSTETFELQGWTD